MRSLIFLLLAAIAVFLSTSTPSSAHLTPNSEVRLQFGENAIAADIIIPLGDYALASGNPTTNDPASIARARQYLQSRIAARGTDGQSWPIRFERIAFEQIAGPPDLHANAVIEVPAGTSPRILSIEWNAVVDSTPGHFALFVATGDFGSGMLGSQRQVLGAVQGDARVIEIDRGQASSVAGFFASVRLGMHHIAEGHDHLLFLVALLLPAPVVAAARKWRQTRSASGTLWLLAKIVTAFTIGHSITLIGAAFLGWTLPAQPVEILIAVSILISALHAARPIFPGRETLVAGGFGLVHGLAFATLVSNYGLSGGEKAIAILGFNLGIEIVQLLVVVAVMPSLLLLARTRYYPVVRNTGATLAAIAALAWIVERIAATPNPVAGAIDSALTWSPVLIAALTMVAIIVYLQSRRSGTLQSA